MLKKLIFLIIFVFCSLPNYYSFEIEWIEFDDDDVEYGNYFEGDMDLSDEQLDAILGNRTALIHENFRWPEATVPYQFSAHHSAELNEKIRNAMDTIQNVSCVQFVPRTNQSDYVQFTVCYNNAFDKQLLSLLLLLLSLLNFHFYF